MRALEKIREAETFLKSYSIEDARREAESIITHCLEIERTALYRDNPIIGEEELGRVEEFLKRRSRGEPLQYVLGYIDFYGLKIKVGQGVLIPRPETELLVEVAINTFIRYTLPAINKNKTSLDILDLCTGSGCLALALAKEFPKTHVYGTDISEVAIKYARENAGINGVKNVTFLKGNLLEPIAQLVTPVTFDLILSNPPYIRRDDIKNLQPEIKDWEPVEALDGGKDGLDYYRGIIPEARRYLKEGGYVILEIGIGQSDKVRKMAEDTGLIVISLIKDYAGIERILIAQFEH